MTFELKIKIEPILYRELNPGELYSWYPASYWHTRKGDDDMELKVRGKKPTSDEEYLKSHFKAMGKLKCTRITFNYEWIFKEEIK